MCNITNNLAIMISETGLVRAEEILFKVSSSEKGKAIHAKALHKGKEWPTVFFISDSRMSWKRLQKRRQIFYNSMADNERYGYIF